MVLQYTIVTGNSTQKLREEVELRIKEGWVPQGEVSVANASNMLFIQAMIKKHNKSGRYL